MWRAGKIGLVVGLIPLCLLIWMASQAQFTMQHPRAPDVKVLVSDGGARLGLNTAGPLAVGPVAQRPPQGLPRLVIGKRRHDFGFMDPLARGSHSFVVKNTGEAPLSLEVASTTCQCTVAGVSDNQIPPGAEGTVQLSWTVPSHGQVFRQIATVASNDPRQKHTSFIIEGCIRTSIGADREELTVLLDPDKSATTEVTIFSQQWDDFDVASLATTVEGLEWEQLPADSKTLESLKAKSGRTLRVTVPASLAAKVSDNLKLSIEPKTPNGEPIELPDGAGNTLELPLHISVRRRLSIYGPAIRSGGLIDVGETQQGVPRQVKMQLKVRDRDLSLPGIEFETTPSFLQAEITPHLDRRTGEAIPGLYDFVVTIPADAPTCSYLGDVLGQVRIMTAHPRIQDTPLAVRFAVLPR